MIFLESLLGNFFKDYGLYIAIGLVLLILIITIFFLVRNFIKSKDSKETSATLLNEIVMALGGRENIKTMEAKMSRLIVSLISDGNIDLQKLKNLGIERVVKMTNKITLIVGNKATELADKFNN